MAAATSPLATEAPPPAAEQATQPDALRTAIAKMLEHAESMKASAESSKASAEIMTEQVASCVSAVKGIQSELEDVRRTANKAAADVLEVQLARTRVPVVVRAAEIIEHNIATPLPPGVSASIHALENAMPKARSENRILSALIAILVVAAEVLRQFGHLH